jgi:signal transduction histidine kinase
MTDPQPAATRAGVLTPGVPSPVRRALKRGTGWPVARMIAVGIAVMVVFSAAAIVAGALALSSLGTARDRVVTTLDPAAYETSQLYAALLNQETGVRGYALSGQPQFLQPYQLGQTDEAHALMRLRQVLTGMPVARRDLTRALARVADWRRSYAEPTMAHVRATGQPYISPGIARGKADFDSLRVSLGALQTYISTQRRHALGGLNSASGTLVVACIIIAAGLLLVVVLLTLAIRNAAIRPLSRLADDARRIADGDFGHELEQSGPRETRDLAADVDRMRQRIVSELSALRTANLTLEARTQDLQRSNSELEQFAYVASHDLQEPLRKVASFCQLLQRRYGGQFDEKADQYIAYAVDGAKRMQMLINDLLAFSRVGRTDRPQAPTPTADLLAQAEANVGTMIRKTHARIEVGELPVVLAEPTLLTAAFQNLLSNAIKFRGEDPPRISVTAERDGDFWQFAVTDNGIGIDSDYADRIFVIFQRLHDKATYPGTGIGLAMVRKIIEYHGGRIWLDTTATSGARFCFTLPVRPDYAQPESVLAESAEPDPASLPPPPALELAGAPREDDDADDH